MITCNRCGKENQDHYKFCLGCGSELAKPAAAPAPRARRAETPRSGARPHRAAAGAHGAAVAGELRTSSPAVPKARGGIPWGDSPKMPAPIPFQLPPNPAGRDAGSARHRRHGHSNGGAVGVPAGATPAPVRVTGAAGLTPLPPPASDEVPCPTCGKAVQAGFAFCGACGTRMAKQPSGPRAATRAPHDVHGRLDQRRARPRVPRGRLILIRPDGSEGGAHPLHDGENIIGRGQAPLFDADAYLSPRHAELSVGPEGVTIRDLQSLNGVFLKITGEEALESGDIFRIGQELLRFEVISPPQPLEDGTEIMGTPNPGFWGRLSVIVGRDVDGSAFPLFGESIVLGRERGDILFPEDGYVSGTHSRIALHDEQVYLSDLGSSNGTFLRLRHERTVPTGSFMLMGQQLFRLEFR